VPIYAPGVALGTSRKMKEEPRGIVDSRLNRPVKWTWSQILGKCGVALLCEMHLTIHGTIIRTARR
jgi:hypothetical protein